MGNLCVSSIKFDIESYIASLIFIFVFVFVFIFVFIFVFVFVLKVKFDACELDKVWHLKLHCFACICLCICLCIHICIKSKNWCATRVWASWGSFAKLHLKLHCFAFAHSSLFHIRWERVRSNFQISISSNFQISPGNSIWILSLKSFCIPFRVFTSQ